MLSRTASNLFWIGRSIERAETGARLLAVGARTALIPSLGGGYRNEWDAILAAGGHTATFVERYGDPVQRNIETFMFFDKENTSSVASCIEQARENGRIVRTALTGQVWDALNTGHQEMQELRRTERSRLSLSDLIDWTTRQCALVRGGIEDTQLRNDGYDFLHLGLALERADATARILDVKYYVLLPDVEFVGTGFDTYQWTSILRAMSSKRAFYWAYGGEITPAKIADLFILNRKSPRSLITSVEDVMNHLDRLARGYHRTTEAQTKVRALMGELCEATVEDIFEEGLHEFLSRMIADVREIADLIFETYLSGDVQR